MTKECKRLTHLTIGLGVLVLLIAGYAFWDKAVEQWYIWKLESEDKAIRVATAEKLADIGSVLKGLPEEALRVSPRDAHPSALFHRLIAGELAEFLKNSLTVLIQKLSSQNPNYGENTLRNSLK